MKCKVTWIFIVCCLLYIHCGKSEKISEPLVETPVGKIKGSILTSRLGKSIHSFRGIRYAQPPVGELRFKPPVPVEKWEGVYDATKDGPLCPQPVDNETISEDCLILNVYSTKLPSGKDNPKRPVMIYIHAGGFYSVGSTTEWCGPQYLMDQDIVLVTFNYRLGSLGFISTGTKDAPGNNGLKDQVEVLKWVKKNIASFGGDPDSVTLIGYSAGGTSVMLHMLSPMSKGLFHRAMVMSGTAMVLAPIPHGQVELARKQAKFVGCPENDTPENIIKCLRTVSYQDLGNSLSEFKEFGTDPVLIWYPVIEHDFGQPRFLTDHPIRLISRGEFMKIPFIVGRTKDEFGYYGLRVISNETLTKEMNDEFDKVAPIAFLYERNTEHSRYVSKNVRKFYFNDQPIDKTQLKALEDVYEDTITGFSADRSAKLITQYSPEPVYYYTFNFQGRYSHVYKPGTNNTVPYGVVHHDDLIYLFYVSPLFPFFDDKSTKEAEMVTKLTTLYANFAKTGNPTPDSKTIDGIKWQRYILNEQKYLDINSPSAMKERLHEKRFQFWDNLYPISSYLDGKLN